MRRTLFALAAFSSALFAQGVPETRVYALTNIDTPQSIQETVNAIRSLAEIQVVTADVPGRRLVITGDAEELAFADWIVKAFDAPLGARPTSFTVRDTTYRDPRSATSVKLVYPVRIASPQMLQEAVNAVRSIAEVQRIVAFTSQKALMMRAAPEQTALAEWMLRDLDTSAGAPRPTRHANTPFRIRSLPRVTVRQPSGSTTPPTSLRRSTCRRRSMASAPSPKCSVLSPSRSAA
jgi:hypothetical protein